MRTLLWTELLVFTFSMFPARAQDPQVLVPESADKRVLVPSSNLTLLWREALEFKDDNWQLCSGAPGGVGYERDSGYERWITLDVGADMAAIPNTSCLIRIPFRVEAEDLPRFQFLALRLRFDDGFVAYLNGARVAGVNAPSSPRWDSPAAETREAGAPETFIINRHLDQLRPGDNLLAVHGLNVSSGSSDFLITVELIAGETEYGALSSSNLPIVLIDTGGREIVDPYRIPAQMGIIYNGPGERNRLTDPPDHYDGRIDIEIRGSSSRSFPKKPYRFETQDSLGRNLNVPLLGMPRENDWILYNPYSDKSMIRNILAFKISNWLGRYASRTRLCEVVLNGDYRGVYVILEKIKRDRGRVDITAMDSSDVAGDAVTGGYIVKIDKTDAGENTGGWTSANGIYYQYHYPKPDEIVPEQKAYLKKLMADFEAVMRRPDYDNPADGFLNWIDLDSFVDHFILNELSRNVDAYRLSAYLYKDRESVGGKLIMGPAWDFNLSFGNADYHQADRTDGWNLDYMFTINFRDFFKPPFWWQVVRHDAEFKSRVYRRWWQLRAGVLKEEFLLEWIDALADSLAEAQVRNFIRWPVLGTYVWPNAFAGDTYEEEIEFLKTWLEERIWWIDDNIGLLADVENSGESPEPARFSLLPNTPNPFNTATRLTYTLEAPAAVRLEVFNLRGQRIRRLVNEHRAAGWHSAVWDGRDDAGIPLASGVYISNLQVGVHSSSVRMLLLR